MNFIKIRGARQHNLKNVDLDIPRDQLVVITGLSGSGKSTLAFDTIYAEGQRRYVESLSTYARQFLERLQKPEVDQIEGLSPAISIEQKAPVHNPRSTVGTVTEIYDYLRLLYARVGVPHCHRCGREITSQSIDQMIDTLMNQTHGSRMIILAPLVHQVKGSHASLIKRLKRDGFARVRINGIVKNIETVAALSKNEKHSIDVVVDRIVLKPGVRNRLADSLELALALSGGAVEIELPDADHRKPEASFLFSEKAACSICGISYPPFTPASFSFNSPHGACHECDGLGTRAVLAPELLVPDPEQSLGQGAVAVWANRKSTSFKAFLKAFTRTYATDIDTPFNDLPGDFKTALFYGSGDSLIEFTVERRSGRHDYNSPFEGLIPQLLRRYKESESTHVREEIQRFMVFRSCPSCMGTRLRPESRAVQIDGRGIHQVAAMSIREAKRFLNRLPLNGQKALIAEKIIREITERLAFLDDVGLAYLTLDRSAQTLSGGESQRIRLATQIGAKLTGVLYVLDEPSIGLHQKDNRKLLQTLTRMKEAGNSVLVVEHDQETIRASDYVIDMGPGAGMQGGNIVFTGTPQKLLSDEHSLTGRYFSGRLSIPIPQQRRTGNGKRISIYGAIHHNLKSIDAGFPLGCFICVTGVSGSGKSTLVNDSLYYALTRRTYGQEDADQRFSKISGLSFVDQVINIDQTPIGRTPRSNPGTYTGVLAPIRDLFSRTTEARIRGYKPGRFSFNAKGGRCEACQGDGIIKIEMHFLPDVYVPCDVCNGRRYNRETLEVRYKGKNISEVLDMTVNQALAFFQRIALVRNKLQTLVDVGLGYIHIGQPSTTLSGGEAQRVKLARELSKKETGRTLYILDEPTTGLHMHDINDLLKVLSRLVDNGNTVIVIEHNLDVIKTADYVIDLGPEGGDGGGFVMGAGTPEEIASMQNSYTGQFLAEITENR